MQRIQDSATRSVFSEPAHTHAAPPFTLVTDSQAYNVQTVHIDVSCLQWHGARVSDRPVQSL